MSSTITNEQIFDRVAEHLLKQGQKSMSDGPYYMDSVIVTNGCMYRGPNGLKCAIGCLISDEMYDHSLEGRPVQSSTVMAAVATSLGVEASVLNFHMLMELQQIHDSFTPLSWRGRLAELRESLFPSGETEHA